MTTRERAKAWMLERCPAEATGTRFGTDDVESGDTDTETGKPCDCLDALTTLIDAERADERSDIIRSSEWEETLTVACEDTRADERKKIADRIAKMRAALIVARDCIAFDGSLDKENDTIIANRALDAIDDAIDEGDDDARATVVPVVTKPSA